MLRKAFGFGTSQALIRLVCSFVSIKFTAVYLGPSGLALIAQFNGLVSLGQGLLGAGLNTATVRLTPEYIGQPQRRRALWSTGLALAAMFATAGVLALLLAGPMLARRLFADETYAWAIALAGLAIAANVFNNQLLGALNGAREIGRVVLSNVLATVAGLLAFAPACMLWGTAGGMVGSCASYLLALLISIGLGLRSPTVHLRDFLGRFDGAEARRILGFYPMLVAHATLTPLAMILVRDVVISSLSLESAGLWQATWRLSEVYTTVITTSVSLYFMPRLGELAGDELAMRNEVWRTLLLVTVLTALMALGIFLLREWIVPLVFSASFLGVQALMPVQLLGDVIKMAAWILGFVLVARINTRWYVAIEIMVPVVLVLGVRWLVPALGAVGAMWAYVLASMVQLALAALGLRRLLFARAR